MKTSRRKNHLNGEVIWWGDMRALINEGCRMFNICGFGLICCGCSHE